VKPNTWRTNRSMFEKWLTPVFGDREMRDIHRENVRKFAYEMLETGLKGRSIKMMALLMIDLFNSAIDDNFVQNNPAERLNVDFPDDSTERYMPPTEDVSATFAQLNENPTVQVFLALTAMTGLRRGEVLGLWWSDVDFRKGTIRVERSLTQANKDKCGSFKNIKWHYSTTLAVVPPKSKTSKRTVNMPGQLADLLQQLRAFIHNESPFVFQQNAEGGPMHPEKLDDVLHDAQDRAGVKRFGFHGLRHLYASRLREAGASPAHTFNRMGHASITMTNRYTHDAADGRAFSYAVARIFPFWC
jgi:integrase